MASISLSSATRALARLSISQPGGSTSARALPSAIRKVQQRRANSTAASTTTTATSPAASEAFPPPTAAKRARYIRANDPAVLVQQRRKREALKQQRQTAKATADEIDQLALAEEQAKLRGDMKQQYRHAKKLCTSGWLGPNQQTELQAALEQSTSYADVTLPDWFLAEWETFTDFRAARARLWHPSFVPEVGPKAESVDAWIQESLQADTSDLDIETKKDNILRAVWKSMDSEQRKQALVEARFTCLQKLGWRQGYSAGYPVTAEEVNLELRDEAIAKSASRSKAGWEALAELQDADVDLAWAAWQDMSQTERRRAETEAWAMRDRTLIYVDDSPEKTVAGTTCPRWYATPQRAGKLTFLPNFTLRLVRNYTPPGQPYDAYKATFRAPLNLHKHAVRSFLLAVYGLRTTWIRSMIYRADMKMNSKRQLIQRPGRNFKKIEVGLLEPFVFPAITPKQKNEELFAGEYEVMQSHSNARIMARTYKRLRGGTPLKMLDATAKQDPWDYDLLNTSASTKEANEAWEESMTQAVEADDGTEISALRSQRHPFVSMKNSKKWTTSHGRILRVLNAKRAEKMRQVDQLALQKWREQNPQKAKEEEERVAAERAQQEQQQRAQQAAEDAELKRIQEETRAAVEAARDDPALFKEFKAQRSREWLERQVRQQKEQRGE